MNNKDEFHRNDNEQQEDTYNNDVTANSVEKNEEHADSSTEETFEQEQFATDAPNEDMTYHTHEETNQTTVEEPIKEPVVQSSANVRSNQKQPKSNGFFSHLISGVTGGLSVAIVGTLLLTTGVIPLEQHDSTVATNPNTSAPEATPTTNIIRTVTMGDDASLADAIQRVSDAVVGVANIQQASLWTEGQDAGTGSGVIYKEDNGKAYVVTNHHVVDGANTVEVILSSGERVEATLLGSDELTDLAVLEIDSSNVTQVATLGSSDNLIVGETAIAIGNPLGTEFAGSVTKGIISGLERSVDIDLNSDGRADWTTEVIQTDAAINPGNSGGALIDSNGEVIGINSMKIALASVEGIGFAIPIDSAKPIIQQLEENGQVARPFMGISAVALETVPNFAKEETLRLPDEVTHGVVIAEVQARSAAEQAGLERYDVITEINGNEIDSMMELKQYLYADTNIGDQIEITFYRQGNLQTTTLTLTNQEAEPVSN